MYMYVFNKVLTCTYIIPNSQREYSSPHTDCCPFIGDVLVHILFREGSLQLAIVPYINITVTNTWWLLTFILVFSTITFLFYHEKDEKICSSNHTNTIHFCINLNIFLYLKCKIKIILSIDEEQFLLSPISLYIIRVVSILKLNFNLH